LGLSFNPRPQFPPKSKHAGGKGRLKAPKALSGNAELGVFDILNTFQCCWFLSWEHLMAQVTMAQKAEDRKFLWVEFSPQFHSHLVKYTVTLVPRPLNKVKKVMFAYILELLNGEGPQAFFDLTKGQCLTMKAQKENKHLAWKRNRASRQECQKVAEEAANGKPKQQCPECG
jgi:hypothetical protein